MKSAGKFTEKDIRINSMYSRIGRATEKMNLTLANVKKMEQHDLIAAKREELLRKKIDKI